MTPATLIANHLAALPHPDGAPRQLPGFAARLLPQPMQEQVTKTAQDIGDAIVYLLKLNGYSIVTEAESTPAPAKETKFVDMVCNKCAKNVLSVPVNIGVVRTNHHYVTQDCPHA